MPILCCILQQLGHCTHNNHTQPFREASPGSPACCTHSHTPLHIHRRWFQPLLHLTAWVATGPALGRLPVRCQLVRMFARTCSTPRLPQQHTITHNTAVRSQSQNLMGVNRSSGQSYTLLVDCSSARVLRAHAPQPSFCRPQVAYSAVCVCINQTDGNPALTS